MNNPTHVVAAPLKVDVEKPHSGNTALRGDYYGKNSQEMR